MDGGDHSFFAAPDAVCRHVTGPASARIYHGVTAENLILGEHAVVADHTRVGDTVLDEYCQLQRYNMVYGSRIGRYTYTGRNTVIWHADIGAFCSISWNVSIGGANHDPDRLTTHAFLYDRKDFGLLPEDETGYDRFREPCTIGSDVWIGAGASIMRGVTVATGAVIGAGAVVTHDVAPYTIVTGIPAAPLRRRFPDDVIERLLASEWWRLPAQVIRENYRLFSGRPTEETLSLLEAVCKSTL